MNLYETWQKLTDSFQTEQEQIAFWNAYYESETENYKKILGEKRFALSGTAAELAESFGMEPAVFVGFLDGANTSLKQPVELETLEDSTELNIEFVPETLFYNMLSAKAKWLYTLKQWDGVLSEKQRADIKMQWRKDHMAVSTKVGRNDPCPCGSGNKYKNCCGV